MALSRVERVQALLQWSTATLASMPPVMSLARHTATARYTAANSHAISASSLSEYKHRRHKAHWPFNLWAYVMSACLPSIVQDKLLNRHY